MATQTASEPERQPESPQARFPLGELVTETLDYDGGRQVTVYVPPNPPEAIVYASDGQGISAWIGSLETADGLPTMIVGVHGRTEEMLRLREYSPAFDGERFAAHERFFVEDVSHWVRSRFDVSLTAGRTGMFGYSAGGELALALGLRHPDVYGAVISGSPGAGYKPPGDLSDSVPRVYLFAGTREPFFLANTTQWAVTLREAGATVLLNKKDASHGDALWRREFPLMLAWAFDR